MMREHDANGMAEPVQRPRQRTDHIPQPAHFGKGRTLSRSEKDVHRSGPDLRPTGDPPFPEGAATINANRAIESYRLARAEPAIINGGEYLVNLVQFIRKLPVRPAILQ
jgi:hypothetical protein